MRLVSSFRLLPSVVTRMQTCICSVVELKRSKSNRMKCQSLREPSLKKSGGVFGFLAVIATHFDRANSFSKRILKHFSSQILLAQEDWLDRLEIKDVISVPIVDKKVVANVMKSSYLCFVPNMTSGSVEG